MTTYIDNAMIVESAPSHGGTRLDMRTAIRDAGDMKKPLLLVVSI